MGAAAAKSAVTRLVLLGARHQPPRPARTARRPPVDCDRFCRDECVAIAMIAACQHNACPAMRACAFALLGCSMIDEVVEGAENFAATMRGADQVLSPADLRAWLSLLAMPPATTVRQ